MSFIDKVRRGEIASPTKKNFDFQTWAESWKKEPEKDKESEKIYEAGKVIACLLNEIRSELSSLHKQAPKVSNQKLIATYFAISNRDRSILSKNSVEFIKGNVNVFSCLLKNNRFSSSLTLEEVANGCVDGIQKAVYLRIKQEEAFVKQELTTKQLPIMELIAKESSLSQIYGAYESYWQALLWGGYIFSEIDKEEKTFCISQKMTSYEIGSVASQIRKSRLDAQSSLIIKHDPLIDILKGDKYIHQYSSNDQTLSVKDLSFADNRIQTMNASWRLQEAYLEGEFPNEVINNDPGCGFSILEALNTLRLLMLLAVQITEHYPEDDAYEDEKKLLSFCPEIKIVRLKKSISKATGYSFEKVSKILSFMEFDGGNKDLWCHSIISINSSSYILLTSALITPVVKRIVEHWIVTLGIDLDKKGKVFEKVYLCDLNNALKNNKFINDYDSALSKRIKINEGEEEIDLLCRIGGIIIIAEVKSIVTTDSNISNYRTLKTLERAASQVNRKTAFVKKHLEAIFKTLNWNFDENVEYSFVKCIINSNRIYVGSIIDDVPVCDEKILIKYFDSEISPLITNKEMKNLAWLELYDSFTSLQQNLDIYLRNLPQVYLSPDGYDYEETPLPYIQKDSYKILYKRIVPKDFEPKDMLSRPYKFPIKTASNIDEELKEISVCI